MEDDAGEAAEAAPAPDEAEVAEIAEEATRQLQDAVASLVVEEAAARVELEARRLAWRLAVRRGVTRLVFAVAAVASVPIFAAVAARERAAWVAACGGGRPRPDGYDCRTYGRAALAFACGHRAQRLLQHRAAPHCECT